MAAMPDPLQLTPELTEITDGLRFPEGPIAMADGSIVLVEMFGPRLTRVAPDGTKTTIAEIEGGPNGAAVGPDGAIYLCNNGGCFAPVEFGGMMFPGAVRPGALHRWPDPACRPARRHRHRSVHRVRRPPTAGAERPRDGRPRRLLVHRPRHPRPCDAHERPDRHLLRQGRRLRDPRGRVPGRGPERHRPVARPRHPVLGRDAERTRVCGDRSSARANSHRRSRST